MRILTRADVRTLVRMESLIEAVSDAHAALSRGAARLAADEPTSLPGGPGLMLPMAGAIDAPPIAGVKVMTDVPDNPARGLRTQHSTVLIVDVATGRCRGVLDGVELTLHRTAAASAVATRHLARRDGRTLGLIGTGAQARTHLVAMRAVRDFERVVVWNRTRAQAERFALEHAGCGIPVTVLDTPEAVIRAADVVCTLTPSRDPIVRGAWFRPGLHVNAVGAPPRPDHRELDTDAIIRATVVVDDRAASLARSGDLCVPLADGAITEDHVHADLGQLVTGARPGRTDARELTVFNSIGLAIQDLAAASALLSAAEAAGVGLEVDLLAP